MRITPLLVDGLGVVLAVKLPKNCWVTVTLGIKVVFYVVQVPSYFNIPQKFWPVPRRYIRRSVLRYIRREASMLNGTTYSDMDVGLSADDNKTRFVIAELLVPL